jgi:hypothetical protein
MKQTMRKKDFQIRHARPGFVLLVTLVLLTLAALAMVAVARAALNRAQSASEAQAELQRRWGTTSCQMVLIPKTETLLHRAELQQQQPVYLLHRTVLLGNDHFDLTLADESAKAKVAILMHEQGREQAELTIRRLSLNSALAGNVQLRWEAARPGDPEPSSFGDVFDDAKPQLLCDHSQGDAPADLLTCWGDGRVNFHRTSETILKEVCGNVLTLTQIQDLVQLRNEQPDLTLAQACSDLQFNDSMRNKAATVLTESPDCYSLWIDCRASRRSDWTLMVGQRAASRWDTRTFEW